MSLKEAQALTYSEFWDDRYTKAVGTKPTHEWFRTFDALEPFFNRHFFDRAEAKGKDQRVLHLGSGDSVGDFLGHSNPGTTVALTNHQTVPYDLLERGYTNQICIDFSTVLVDCMKSRYAEKPEVQWQVGDLRDMTGIETNSVDIAFDKSTMDAMIHGSPWNPPEEVLKNTGMYIDEVSER
jgi:hypothetical protein